MLVCMLAATLTAATLLGAIVTMVDDQMLADYRGLKYGFVPLVEEIAFRGIILQALRCVFDGTRAVWVTALLFAIAHLTPLTLVHHTLAGLTFGMAAVRSQSVWTAVACHAAYNFSVVLLTW